MAINPIDFPQQVWLTARKLEWQLLQPEAARDVATQKTPSIDGGVQKTGRVFIALSKK